MSGVGKRLAARVVLELKEKVAAAAGGAGVAGGRVAARRVGDGGRAAGAWLYGVGGARGRPAARLATLPVGSSLEERVKAALRVLATPSKLRCRGNGHSDARRDDRPGARLRLHQWLPRHRERDRHVVSPRGLAAHAIVMATAVQLHRRLRRAPRWPRPSAPDSVDRETTTTAVVAAALIGAIVWNLITWYCGCPARAATR